MYPRHLTKTWNSRRRDLRKRAEGFTLLEVLLVLVILGVIAALVVPQLTGSQQRAMIMAAQTRIKELQAKVELYAVEHMATYPNTLDELLNPVDTNGQPMQPYEREFPKDPWQQPLNYQPPANQGDLPRIWSNGPNRRNEDGGGDDIANWTNTGTTR